MTFKNFLNNTFAADYNRRLNKNEQTLTTAQALWQSYTLEHYRLDAERAIGWVQNGELDRLFIERVFELLRTYVEFPGVGKEPQSADAAILRLAHLVATRLTHLGYGRQMIYLWPTLCAIAEFTGDAELYINFTKYLAIVNGRQTDKQTGDALYTAIINHPYFQQTSFGLQADILSHYATLLLWSGQRKAAEPLLQRCLFLTESYNNMRMFNTSTVAYDRRLNTGAGPLWEIRAYALNQQGVLHMFCANFAKAHDCFDEMLTIFLERGEVNNLACVAYQAIGRLLLYEGSYTKAQAFLANGLRIRIEREDSEGIAVNSIYKAATHIALHQFQAAEVLLKDALSICQDLDNLHDLALCHLYLGELALHCDRYSEANYHWQKMVTLATKSVLHFIEVCQVSRELPRLLLRGNVILCGKLVKTLWDSTSNDQLTFPIIKRFLSKILLR